LFLGKLSIKLLENHLVMSTLGCKLLIYVLFRGTIWF
jgi:hypothetical protein